MLYRYKSKWYMPTDVQSKYGLSKAKLMQKDFKRFYKKTRNKLIIKPKTANRFNKQNGFNIPSTLIPSLLNQKQNSLGKRKYTRIKSILGQVKLKKQRFIIKKYLNKILSEGSNEKTKENKIKLLTNALRTLNVFHINQQLITKLRNIKNKILKKSELNRTLKKRIINMFTLTSKYFLNYPIYQKNILITSSLLAKQKKLKKMQMLLRYLKVKQSFLVFKAKEKENYVYNEEILDSNFMENNLRENLGTTPAKNLSDYVVNRIIIKAGHHVSKYSLQVKKILQFRLKKKNKYKKNYDKIYYKKRRLVFQERSYNRFGLNDIKKTKLKTKKQAVSLLNLSLKKIRLAPELKVIHDGLFSNFKIQLRAKKKNKRLLFISALNFIDKIQRSKIVKNKMQLFFFIKLKFVNFVRLLKLELKKNNKIIKKFTKKLLFLKKQKGLLYRKRKIEVLNLRDYFIRENQKLREEIKNYRYIWKNSPFSNYNQSKQTRLSSLIELRKTKYSVNKLMAKYPEGVVAFKERIKNGQYYTGLSLLKRKLAQSVRCLDLSAFIRAFALSNNPCFIFGQLRVKWVFSGPKRSYTLCYTKLWVRYISTKLTFKWNKICLI